MTTPRLALTPLVSGQAIPETNVNEAVRWLEQGASSFSFKSKTVSAQPGSPVDGDCYLLPGSPTGANWSGQGGKIAQFVNTAWEFKTAQKGMVGYVVDADIFIGCNSAATWITLSSGAITVDNDTTLAGDSATNVASQHATKAYVDAKVAGLSWKQEVRAATTANGTLATAFANGQAIDGVTLATGDRILVKNQTTGSENGIYVVAASGAPARATDADAGSELVNASCYVSEGSTQADTQWTCSTNAPITPGSTALTFAQLTSGTGTITALTGDVTASGSGSVPATVANANYSATLTASGTPPTNALGYLGAPQNIQNASYTTVMTDAGKHLYHTSGIAHTWTIDSNANVAYPIGTILTFINENAGGVITLAVTSDTLRWSSSTGSRSLAANGTATAVKVSATVWRLTGDGIT